MADRNIYAPMVSTAQMDNLNYKFVANDNELYINIIEPDYMVEKTNVYVTVKEVPDLQGNLMESPLTMNVYVYRNPLRWDVKRIEKEIGYGEGLTFEATVKNLSGITQNYSLEDLPLWISASHTSGTIGALDEETIKANARFFDREEDVPRYAISMGIKTIMLARRVILLASGAAKAEAVHKTLCGSVTPKAPASILQLHQDVTIILDKEAAALLPKEIYGVRIDNYS
jgi:hypothetical protein